MLQAFSFFSGITQYEICSVRGNLIKKSYKSTLPDCIYKLQNEGKLEINICSLFL